MNYPIVVKELSVYYDKIPVLWGVNVSIPEGQLVAIVGPNGGGKSTFLKSLVGIIPTLSGNIECFGKAFSKVRNQIAYVPQKESVDWDFPISVLEVVLMGKFHDLGFFKWPRRKDREKAFEILKLLEMDHLATRQISELSGGQQQRVFIARALMQEADVYLLDEPFTGVDAATEVILVRIFKELRKKGKTVVIVHHDLQNIETLFDWMVLLNTRVIAAGNVQEVFTQENLAKTYGRKEEIFLEMVGQLKRKESGNTL